MTLLAFDVTIDSTHAIVWAETPAKARWQAVKAYRDAGYGRQREWPRPTARRVPRYDDHPLKDRTDSRAWVPEYVEDTRP